MRDLQAVKSFVYASRRLRAGDYFTARTSGDARVLVAIGKAQKHGDAPASAPVDEKQAMAKLRADYQEVLKKKPFAGWDAAELQRRIDQALSS